MSPHGQSICIAVAGGSCSGKSTLERNLQLIFRDTITTISFDDFFVGLKALEGRTIKNWDDPGLYRWDEYKKTVLKLKSGQVAEFEPHSYESKAEGISRRLLQPKPIIIAAGFLALHKREIRTLFDTAVFIDLPEEEIVRRRLARAQTRKLGAWDSPGYVRGDLLRSHREYIQPQAKIADHVIDGTKSPQEIAEEVGTIIRLLLAAKGRNI